MATKAPADLLDMDQTIRLLGTTRPTFYRWLKEGKIKGMKVGRQWRFYRADVERFLKGEEPRIELAADIEPLIQALGRKFGIGEVGGERNSADGVAAAFNLLIRGATSMRASDVHLMYAGNRGRAEIRFRIDGVLHPIVEFDLRLLNPLIERMKSMAECDLHAKGRPQDGWITAGVDGSELKMRAAFIPTLQGESVTLRLIETGVPLKLEEIEFSPRDMKKLVDALRLPWGAIVITGPTGSGKTTVLYTAVQRLAKPELKVMTIEDPVEIELPGVVQTPVRNNLGATFPALIKSIARSDPDVVMIGEIRDQESARLCMMMALTGHLVLTTLHTDDAASALVRMIDVVGDPMMPSDALKLVLAQRLVRRVCAKCSVEGKPDAQVLSDVVQLARGGGIDVNTLPQKFRKAAGCKECSFTGYRGRTVIAEALEVTPEISAAMKRSKDARELRRIAVSQGMTSMFADGFRRAGEGVTTLAEVQRVAPRE